MNASANPSQPACLLDRLADMADRMRAELVERADMSIVDILITVLVLECLVRIAALYVQWKAGLLPSAGRARAGLSPALRRRAGASPSNAAADPHSGDRPSTREEATGARSPGQATGTEATGTGERGTEPTTVSVPPAMSAPPHRGAPPHIAVAPVIARPFRYV
jgi:hypothetical protein